MDCPINVAAQGWRRRRETFFRDLLTAFVLFLFVELLFVFNGSVDRMLIYWILQYRRGLSSFPYLCLFCFHLLSSYLSACQHYSPSSRQCYFYPIKPPLLSSQSYSHFLLFDSWVGRCHDVPFTQYPLLSSSHFFCSMWSFVLMPATHGSIYWLFYVFFPQGALPSQPPLFSSTSFFTKMLRVTLCFGFSPFVTFTSHFSLS